MSEIEKKKYYAIQTLRSLCPRCDRGEEHHCPVSKLASQVSELKLVPINVNDRLYSVSFLN